jgi:ABC-type ATPase involved in cell division
LIRFEEVTWAATSPLSFTLPRGGLAWLVGPSGAGKTTALRLLHGALQPRQGRVLIDDQDLRALSRDALPLLRRKVALLETQPRLLRAHSLLDNVALPLRIAGEPEEVCLRRAREVMADVGVAQHLHARPDEVGPAARARCALARALAASPSVLLADEPGALLDAALRRDLLALLREAQLRGVTCVLTANDDRDANPLREQLVHLPLGEAP